MATLVAGTVTEQEALETSGYDYVFSMPCEKYNVQQLMAQLLPPLYALVFGVGLLGNVMVVVILIKYRRLSILTNIYLLNLAISDLLFLVTLPFWIHYAQQGQWVFGYDMCKLLSGFYSMGFYGETFFIILLTIDRYLAIVHAMFALRARTVSFGIMSSFVTWVLIVLIALPEIIFTRAQDEQGYFSCVSLFPEGDIDTWKRLYIAKINTLSLVLPLLVMVVCYSGIIKTLVRCPNRMKYKAMRLIVVIMVVFFIFWAPYNLALFLHTFQTTFFETSCEQSNQLDVAIMVTEVIAYTHSCINPVIYAFVGERFREHLRHFFRRHVAVYLGKCIRLRASEAPDRASSASPSTMEQELIGIF
ncbi:C-C chemokine receptor type 3 [Artibeus jamaicensis]|uniref:C-C chemokine receptor type 3 n=1 Tax=Artibeus jamaicensis TaxID=9417 RepID=UPI00235A68C0|nr:C-C chemokine receptor type 3 [Artibeus jamaicensis]XP_036985846.2 C-C chemokine receptor type 3 [Artibeus jamaicensis]XP_053524964.1 C-C chemokine receptor type 3 [Artibeus jamaicensis]XP_053524965.1 C-C chemokine receptor type 3 [Artibeus jamaicensis]